MPTYLHGVENIEQGGNQLTISESDLSNVVVIGMMPVFEIEDPKKINKITSYNYTAQIGSNIEGFTIPEAVQTILDESGGANIYTINIYDNDKHTASVDKTAVFVNGVCKLSEVGVQNLAVKNGDTTLEIDVDYSFENNTIVALEGGKIEASQENVTVSYKYVDFSKITDSDVIGSVDKNNVRTGIQAVYDIIADYGIKPGIIIAPGFSSKTVRNALEIIAEKTKSFVFADAPKGTNVNLLEKARLKDTDGVDLTTTSERLMLCAPWVLRYNQNEDKTSLKPLSPVLAGLRVMLDRQRNVAKSIDNTASKTILGTEFPISFVLDDPTTDSNRLNSIGITTVINHKGQYYVWGGRNANFPSKEGIKTFESTRRTSDFIQISIQDSQFVCIGEKLTKGFIDDILNIINSKFAAWAGGSDPLIYGGEAYFDETLNTAEAIANGHLYLPWDYCPVATAERVTNLPNLDIKIITKSLGG